MEFAVEAHRIGKRYGGLSALEELTLVVRAGEILGVLGPNGAGKTTAIRILTTILSPSTGTFTVAGVPHTRPGVIRRRIGVLPESAGYPDRQTAEEYIVYHARLYGHSRASARAVARSLLEEVQLDERARSSIGTFSRGMRQRLGIARALVNDPKVVFLDEPTLGLDPAGQRQILSTIRAIAEERGATVLLSTHLLAEVEETCTRVVILNRGRLMADGTVSEIARRAAAPRSGSLRVEPELVEHAAAILRGAPGVSEVVGIDGRAGWLTVMFRPARDQLFDGAPNDAVRALLDAGVPLLFFELEGARLSDAFLAMTEAA
jgi:ABC-2 type transport system ATP-binding protein